MDLNNLEDNKKLILFYIKYKYILWEIVMYWRNVKNFKNQVKLLQIVVQTVRNYEFLDIMGRGGFGKVYKVKRRKNK